MPPPSVTDILHRTFVTGLAALSVYGLYVGGSVHKEILRRGEEALREHEAKQGMTDEQLQQRELELAEAVQRIGTGRTT